MYLFPVQGIRVAVVVTQLADATEGMSTVLGQFYSHKKESDCS